MRMLGIDPGKSGGAAVVKFDRHGMPILEEHMRMPLITEGKRDLVDTRGLGRGLGLSTVSINVVVLERVNAMPKQGVSSSFNFGRHTGAVEGLALALGKPIHWVSPSQWKKGLGLSSDKRASLDLARLTFGDMKIWDTLANDGCAEAALMTVYAYRQIRPAN